MTVDILHISLMYSSCVAVVVVVVIVVFALAAGDEYRDDHDDVFDNDLIAMVVNVARNIAKECGMRYSSIS